MGLDDVQLVALLIALVSLVGLLVCWCGRPITREEAARRGVVGIIVNEPTPSGLPYTWGEFARDTRDPNVSLDYIAQRCFDAGGVPRRVSSAPTPPPPDDDDESYVLGENYTPGRLTVSSLSRGTILDVTLPVVGALMGFGGFGLARKLNGK
jgi:hypothetical protein